jgi:hypothetical protein
MPWGVMKGSYTPGAAYSIYTDNSTPNNGALSLNTVSGTSCNTTSGASDYRDEITGAQVICPAKVGDVVSPKTGQNAGPTKQGLDIRVTTWLPVSSIVSVGVNGLATLILPSSPQVVLIPVVENMSGGTTWPSGSGTVRIVGFAVFVMTGYTAGGKQITGEYVDSQLVNTDWTTGAWTGTANGTSYTVEPTA